MFKLNTWEERCAHHKQVDREKIKDDRRISGESTSKKEDMDWNQFSQRLAQLLIKTPPHTNTHMDIGESDRSIVQSRTSESELYNNLKEAQRGITGNGSESKFDPSVSTPRFASLPQKSHNQEKYMKCSNESFQTTHRHSSNRTKITSKTTLRTSNCNENEQGDYEEWQLRTSTPFSPFSLSSIPPASAEQTNVKHVQHVEHTQLIDRLPINKGTRSRATSESQITQLATQQSIEKSLLAISSRSNSHTNQHEGEHRKHKSNQSQAKRRSRSNAGDECPPQSFQVFSSELQVASQHHQHSENKNLNEYSRTQVIDLTSQTSHLHDSINARTGKSLINCVNSTVAPVFDSRAISYLVPGQNNTNTDDNNQKTLDRNSSSLYYLNERFKEAEGEKEKSRSISLLVVQREECTRIAPIVGHRLRHSQSSLQLQFRKSDENEKKNIQGSCVRTFESQRGFADNFPCIVPSLPPLKSFESDVERGINSNNNVSLKRDLESVSCSIIDGNNAASSSKTKLVEEESNRPHNAHNNGHRNGNDNTVNFLSENVCPASASESLSRRKSAFTSESHQLELCEAPCSSSSSSASQSHSQFHIECERKLVQGLPKHDDGDYNENDSSSDLLSSLSKHRRNERSHIIGTNVSIVRPLHAATTNNTLLESSLSGNIEHANANLNVNASPRRCSLSANERTERSLVSSFRSRAFMHKKNKDCDNDDDCPVGRFNDDTFKNNSNIITQNINHPNSESNLELNLPDVSHSPDQHTSVKLHRNSGILDGTRGAVDSFKLLKFSRSSSQVNSYDKAPFISDLSQNLLSRPLSHSLSNTNTHNSYSTSCNPLNDNSSENVSHVQLLNTTTGTTRTGKRRSPSSSNTQLQGKNFSQISVSAQSSTNPATSNAILRSTQCASHQSIEDHQNADNTKDTKTKTDLNRQNRFDVILFSNNYDGLRSLPSPTKGCEWQRINTTRATNHTVTSTSPRARIKRTQSYQLLRVTNRSSDVKRLHEEKKKELYPVTHNSIERHERVEIDNDESDKIYITAKSQSHQLDKELNVNLNSFKNNCVHVDSSRIGESPEKSVQSPPPPLSFSFSIRPRHISGNGTRVGDSVHRTASTSNLQRVHYKDSNTSVSTATDNVNHSCYDRVMASNNQQHSPNKKNTNDVNYSIISDTHCHHHDPYGRGDHKTPPKNHIQDRIRVTNKNKASKKNYFYQVQSCAIDIGEESTTTTTSTQLPLTIPIVKRPKSHKERSPIVYGKLSSSTSQSTPSNSTTRLSLSSTSSSSSVSLVLPVSELIQDQERARTAIINELKALASSGLIGTSDQTSPPRDHHPPVRRTSSSHRLNSFATINTTTPYFSSSEVTYAEPRPLPPTTIRKPPTIPTPSPSLPPPPPPPPLFSPTPSPPPIYSNTSKKPPSSHQKDMMSRGRVHSCSGTGNENVLMGPAGGDNSFHAIPPPPPPMPTMTTTHRLPSIDGQSRQQEQLLHRVVAPPHNQFILTSHNGANSNNVIYKEVHKKSLNMNGNSQRPPVSPRLTTISDESLHGQANGYATGQISREIDSSGSGQSESRPIISVAKGQSSERRRSSSYLPPIPVKYRYTRGSNMAGTSFRPQSIVEEETDGHYIVAPSRRKFRDQGSSPMSYHRLRQNEEEHRRGGNSSGQSGESPTLLIPVSREHHHYHTNDGDNSRRVRRRTRGVRGHHHDNGSRSGGGLSSGSGDSRRGTSCPHCSSSCEKNTLSTEVVTSSDASRDTNCEAPKIYQHSRYERSGGRTARRLAAQGMSRSREDYDKCYYYDDYRGGYGNLAATRRRSRSATDLMDSSVPPADYPQNSSRDPLPDYRHRSSPSMHAHQSRKGSVNGLAGWRNRSMESLHHPAKFYASRSDSADDDEADPTLPLLSEPMCQLKACNSCKWPKCILSSTTEHFRPAVVPATTSAVLGRRSAPRRHTADITTNELNRIRVPPMSNSCVIPCQVCCCDGIGHLPPSSVDCVICERELGSQVKKAPPILGRNPSKALPRKSGGLRTSFCEVPITDPILKPSFKQPPNHTQTLPPPNTYSGIVCEAGSGCPLNDTPYASLPVISAGVGTMKNSLGPVVVASAAAAKASISVPILRQDLKNKESKSIYGGIPNGKSHGDDPKSSSNSNFVWDLEQWREFQRIHAAIKRREIRKRSFCMGVVVAIILATIFFTYFGTIVVLRVINSAIPQNSHPQPTGTEGELAETDLMNSPMGPLARSDSSA